MTIWTSNKIIKELQHIKQPQQKDLWIHNAMLFLKRKRETKEKEGKKGKRMVRE